MAYCRPKHFRGKVFEITLSGGQRPRAAEACRKAGSFTPPELPGFRATMGLSDSPPDPSSFPRTVELRTPPAGVSLSAPRSPLADMPCPRPRRSGAIVGCFAACAAFPVSQAGRRPRCSFRELGGEACSGLLRVTACRLARPAFPGLCHQASARPVTRPSRSSASMRTDNYIGGLLPPTGCPRRKGALRNAG